MGDSLDIFGPMFFEKKREIFECNGKIVQVCLFTR